MRLGLLMIVLTYPYSQSETMPSRRRISSETRPSRKGTLVPRIGTRATRSPALSTPGKRRESSQGKACLCIKKTANRYFPIASWSQTIERTGDSPVLQVSAQVKAKDATKAILDVLFLDARDEWISHKWAAYVGSKKPGDPPANHDWKQYSGSVEIPPNTKKIVIGLQDYGPGTVWFDELASYAKEPPRKPNESPTN